MRVGSGERETPRRKAVASPRKFRGCFFVAASVRLHGARPWHPRESSNCFFLLAASVRLHGARPWHLQKVSGVSFFCSGEREATRRKAVASLETSNSSFFIAASVRLHGARPWHPKSTRQKIPQPSPHRILPLSRYQK